MRAHGVHTGTPRNDLVEVTWHDMNLFMIFKICNIIYQASCGN